MGVFRLFHLCFKNTSRLFQECFNVIVEYLMEVQRIFIGRFFQIEFAWVTEITSVHKHKPFLT